MKLRVADYITDKLYQAGGEQVFLVTGGMIMHLTDALLTHPKQKYICCHHEQAVVMAAEAYGRASGKLGVAYVTAGPGALNTLTSVVGAFVDTSPCVIVSGQSKVSQAKVSGPRQFAMQGFNTLPIFEKVTKYAVMLDDIKRVRYEVEKCIYLAKTGRVGPVWLEVPIDIQGALFDPQEHDGFVPEVLVKERIDHQGIKAVAQAFRNSKRPCLLAGAGVRLSGSVELLDQFCTQLNLPFMTSRLGMDLVDHQHALFVGRPGTYGDRASNFTIQNSDLFISVGCRLAIGLVGYDYAEFAKHATKVMVDLDRLELSKPAVRPDIALEMDAKLFFQELLRELQGFRFVDQKWIEQTQAWKQRYPVDLPEYQNEKEGINSYHFTARLAEQVGPDAVFLCDTGSCFHVFAQAFKVKEGQRHIITGGLSTMGYSPASIGVSAALPGRDVYCITGDGSVQFNLQEFQTIVHNQLPIKTIIFNNNGYLLIRITQNNFQEGRLIGIDQKSGISFPDMSKIAKAYGIEYMSILSLAELPDKLEQLISFKGPLICEVATPTNQLLMPRVAAKKQADGSMLSMPYDDMFPYLPREEYAANDLWKKL